MTTYDNSTEYRNIKQDAAFKKFVLPVQHLIPELRDDCGATFSLSYDDNTANLAINDRRVVLNAASAVPLYEAIVFHINRLCMSERAQANLKWLQAQALEEVKVTGFQCYKDSLRMHPRVHCAWGWFFDRIAGNGRMAAHTYNFRAHEMALPEQQFQTLAKGVLGTNLAAK